MKGIGDPLEWTKRGLIRIWMVMVMMGVEWKVEASEQVKRIVKGEQTHPEYWMFVHDELWHWVTAVYDHVCESSARRNLKSG